MQSTLLTECIPHEWSLSQRINSRLWNPPPPLLFRVGRRNRNLENKWRLRYKITNWQNVYHSFHFLCVLPLFSFSPRHFVACKILVLSFPRLKPITIFCHLTHTIVHHFLPSTLILRAAYYQRLNLGLNWAWSLRRGYFQIRGPSLERFCDLSVPNWATS